MSISPKNLLKKALKCKSADGFISQYRDYLLNGDLFPITAPILAKVDQGDLLPTPAVEELINIFHAHVQAHDLALAEASLKRTPSQPKIEKPIAAIIYNGNGEEVESEGYHLNQDAIRWVDRHLIVQSSDCYGKVIHNKVLIKGEKMEETITREDSFLRMFPRGKSPVMKRSPQSVSSLKGKMKAVQSRANFSHG